MNPIVALTCALALSTSCAHEWKNAEPSRTLSALESEISTSQKLKRLAQEFWQHTLSTSPVWATFIGNRQYDHLLPDISVQAIEADYAFGETLLTRVKEINKSELNEYERITHSVLEKELTNQLDCQKCKTWLWVVDQLDGPQISFAELSGFHTIKTPDDALSLAARYVKLKDYYARHVENLKLGLAQGYTSPKSNIAGVISQLDAQLALPPEQSPYFEAANRFPKAFSEAQKNKLKAKILESIHLGVYPGLKTYRDFLKSTLVKAAREQVSVGALSMGKECYRALVNFHTGLKISPEEIHQLGLREVKRIMSEMQALAQKTKGAPSLERYIQILRKAPAQYLETKEELLAYNKNLVARAQKALPRAFGKLPHTPIEVKSMEAFRDKAAPAGYYYEAPSDASRPAYYYLNTHEASRRPLYNMSALAFHEALPGHHLQIALANENQHLPEFQRKIGQTAFIEGWALYAESLAGELGLYDTIEEKLGALNYELWRALRLVVDTGIHHKGWSRDKAINYLAKQSALPKMEVVNEIDRYVIWPGQALAYKIGQLEISALRKQAQTTLGPQFDLRSFHDRLLAFGPIPLLDMRQNMESWISEQEISAGHKGLMLMP